VLSRYLLLVALVATPLFADKPGKGHHRGHGPKHHEARPKLPPGLAKKFGPRIPPRPYIAFDPRHEDRAWFLIDGRWVLHEGLPPEVRLEVRNAVRLPVAPPPVPLPKVGVDLRVVLFN